MRFERGTIALYGAGVALGLANLFAYNSFLSSPTYFEHYFQYAAVKNTDDVNTLPAATHSSFWGNIATWVTVLLMIPNLIGQCLMLTPFMLNMNVQIRMMLGAVLLLVSMLLIPVCAAGGGVSENGAMAVLIVSVCLGGFATSVLQSSLFGFFGTLPSQFMAAFVFGGGLSGSVNSILRIIISSSLPSSFSGVKTSAVIFFSIGMALMALTICLVVAMRYNAHVIENCKTYPIGSSDVEVMRMTNGPSDVDLTQKSVGSATAGSCPEGETDENAASSIVVIKKIWPMMVCMCITLFTSLLFFPGMGLKAMYDNKDDEESQSTNNGQWEPEALMPMVIILMFNVGDTIGRFMTNLPFLWLPRKHVWILVVSRIVVCVIPLALGMAPSKIINSNANPIVVMLFLGATGGYLIGVTMSYGAGDARLKTEKERATGGNCMCFSLLAGASLGSVVSLLILTFAY